MEEAAILRPDWDTPERSIPGRIVHAIRPALESAGIRTIAGTVDEDGMEVSAGGERWRIELLKLDTRPCPLDGWPHFDRGNPLAEGITLLFAGVGDEHDPAQIQQPIDPGD